MPSPHKSYEARKRKLKLPSCTLAVENKQVFLKLLFRSRLIRNSKENNIYKKEITRTVNMTNIRDMKADTNERSGLNSMPNRVSWTVTLKEEEKINEKSDSNEKYTITKKEKNGGTWNWKQCMLRTYCKSSKETILHRIHIRQFNDFSYSTEGIVTENLKSYIRQLPPRITVEIEVTNLEKDWKLLKQPQTAWSGYTLDCIDR